MDICTPFYYTILFGYRLSEYAYALMRFSFAIPLNLSVILIPNMVSEQGLWYFMILGRPEIIGHLLRAF